MKEYGGVSFPTGVEKDYLSNIIPHIFIELYTAVVLDLLFSAGSILVYQLIIKYMPPNDLATELSTGERELKVQEELSEDVYNTQYDHADI